MVFPSANGIQHKNTALANGVQPLWPPKLRVQVKFISNTTCLQTSHRLLKLECLGLLASGKRCPPLAPQAAYVVTISEFNHTREWTVSGWGQSATGKESVG